MSLGSSVGCENVRLPNHFIRAILMPDAILPPEILEHILEFALVDDHNYNLCNLRHLLEASVSVRLPLIHTVGSVCKHWRQVVLNHYYFKVRQYLSWYYASAEQVEKTLCDHVFFKGSFEYYLQEGMLSIWELSEHFERVGFLSFLAGFLYSLCWQDYHFIDQDLLPRDGVTEHELRECPMYMYNRPCGVKKRQQAVSQLHRPFSRIQFEEWFDMDMDIEAYLSQAQTGMTAEQYNRWTS